MWKKYEGPAKELNIVSLDVEREDVAQYVGKFKTPSGTVLDNQDLSLLRWKHTGVRNPETNALARRRALYSKGETAEIPGRDAFGNDIMIRVDRLYDFSELERVA